MNVNRLWFKLCNRAGTGFAAQTRRYPDSGGGSLRRLGLQGLVAVPLVLLCMSCAGTTVRFVEPHPQVVCEKVRAGTLVVRVLDPYGDPLPGFVVDLLEPSGDVKRSLAANPDGVVKFHELPSSGICTVRCAWAGFETTIAKDVPCSPSCETTVDLPMKFDAKTVVITRSVGGVWHAG